MVAQKALIQQHLDAGGTVVAMGESNSELWLPNVQFHSCATNWWWWLTPGADLGGIAIAGALEKAGVSGDQVEYVIMGQVIQAGAGQITARQAAVKGGIPMQVPALTSASTRAIQSTRCSKICRKTMLLGICMGILTFLMGQQCWPSIT